MPKMRTKYVCLLLVSFFLLPLVSCSTYDYNEYEYIESQQFTLDDGIISFSFEYPVEYKYNQVSSSVESSFTSVDFDRTTPIEGWDESSFSIFVYKAGSYSFPENAKSALKENIQYREDKYSEDFKIIKKKSINIAGMKGTLLFSSYPSDEFYVDADASNLKEPTVFTLREVFFDYDNLVFGIWMLSIEETADADEAGFRHILNTFQILE